MLQFISFRPIHMTNFTRQSGTVGSNTSGAPPLSDKGYEAAPGEPVKQRLQGKKPPPPKPPSLLKIIYNRALKQLSSLPLAIGELLLLAGLSSVGTFIEQNQSLAYYAEMYPNTGAKVRITYDLHTHSYSVVSVGHQMCH